MQAKWDVTGIIGDHVRTLVDNRDGKVRVLDLVAFYLFPLGCGVLSWTLGATISNTQHLLAGLAVFTGLLFGLLIHVFTLGMRVSEDRGIRDEGKTARMVDQLQANAGYATLVGLLTTAGLIALLVVYDEDEVPGPVSAVVVVMLVHLFMTLLMVLKRIRSMYRQFRRLGPPQSQA
jgi:hypothetical protein